MAQSVALCKQRGPNMPAGGAFLVNTGIRCLSRQQCITVLGVDEKTPAFTCLRGGYRLLVGGPTTSAAVALTPAAVGRPHTFRRLPWHKPA